MIILPHYHVPRVLLLKNTDVSRKNSVILRFPWNISNTIMLEGKYMQVINQIYKNKFRKVLWKNQENKYHPKIETVKYLELIDQDKID